MERAKKRWDGVRRTTGSSGIENVQRTEPILMKNPKVAAELPIYVARVAMDPLGPGPARTMDVRPKMNPMVNPTPAGDQSVVPLRCFAL